MTNNKRKNGFTIIEVVLVLAIAGLIFLMVFVALPALQRSQRNTQIREDANRVMTAISTYMKHNNNKLPFTVDGGLDTNFIIRYVDSQCQTNGSFTSGDFTQYNFKNCGPEFAWPDGTSYSVKIMNGHRDYNNRFNDEQYHSMHFIAGTKCGELENTLKKTPGINTYSVLVKLEGISYYCVDNS